MFNAEMNSRFINMQMDFGEENWLVGHNEPTLQSAEPAIDWI